MSEPQDEYFRVIRSHDAEGTFTGARLEVTPAAIERFGEEKAQEMLEAVAGGLILQVDLLEDPDSWSPEAREAARALDALGGDIRED